MHAKESREFSELCCNCYCIAVGLAAPFGATTVAVLWLGGARRLEFA